METMDFLQGLTVHESIQKGSSIPPVEKCITCCFPGKYHCPFCEPENFNPSAEYLALNLHLKRHFRSAVHVGDYTIHKCGLGCRSQPHFHCLFCPATLIRRVDLKRHLVSCNKFKQSVAQRSTQEGLTEGLVFPSLTERSRNSSFDMESNNDYKGMSFSLDSDNQNSQGASSSSRLLTSPDSEYEAAGQNSSKCVQTDLDKPQDCDEFYFMNLVKIFKKLSPEKKANVRLKIERLLFEAEFV